MHKLYLRLLTVVKHDPTMIEHKNILLRQQDRTRIIDLLTRYVPQVTALAYGSRVNGHAHDASDLDLALKNSNGMPIEVGDLSALRYAFSNSNIPILIDVRDWARLPENFQAEIERHHVVLYPS